MNKSSVIISIQKLVQKCYLNNITAYFFLDRYFCLTSINIYIITLMYLL